MTTWRTVLLGFAMLGLLAVSAAPSTGQEEPLATFTVDAKMMSADDIVEPITGVGAARALVTVRCESPSIMTSLTPKQLQIHASTDYPAFASVSYSPANFFLTFSPEECLQGAEHEVEVSIATTMNKDTPAFLRVPLKLVADLEGGVHASASWTHLAGFYDHSQARFDKAVFKVEPAEIISIPLVIENFGNGGIIARFSANSEQSSPMLAVAIPPPTIVASTIQGGETNMQLVNVEVRAPFGDGFINRQDALVLDIEGHSADDTTQAIEPMQVTAIIHTQGNSNGVGDTAGELPSLGLVSFLGALVPLAAMIGHARRLA